MYTYIIKYLYFPLSTIATVLISFYSLVISFFLCLIFTVGLSRMMKNYLKHFLLSAYNYTEQFIITWNIYSCISIIKLLILFSQIYFVIKLKHIFPLIFYLQEVVTRWWWFLLEKEERWLETLQGEDESRTSSLL